MRVERVVNEPAYVLHTWPYRETSSILDTLSEQHGRVRLVARGVKRAKGGHALRPFNRLALTWAGRDELKSLHRHELVQHRWLQGDLLLAGLYANEITLRALRRYKAEESLFTAYEALLEGLVTARQDEPGTTGQIEAPLRCYELSLLGAIGYGMGLEVDADGQDLEANAWYQFDSGLGVVPAMPGEAAFQGAVLLAMGRREFDDLEVRRAAKRLLRQALSEHIGAAPLMSPSLHS